MNKKILAILATCTLMFTTVTAAGCASKRAKLVETTPQTSIRVTETEATKKPQETADPLVINPVSHTETESKTAEPVGIVNMVKNDTPAANTKPAAKKAAKKTTKKTAKKTAKKTKKTTKKTAKKTTKKKTTKTSSKKTTAKFSYGRSAYSYKNLYVYVNIKKDNTVDFQVAEIRHNAPDIQYEIVWNGKGTFNPKTNTIVYKSFTKSMNVLTSTGQSLKTQYQNGSGKFILNGKTLKWNDSVDHKGNNFKFVKI